MGDKRGCVTPGSIFSDKDFTRIMKSAPLDPATFAVPDDWRGLANVPRRHTVTYELQAHHFSHPFAIPIRRDSPEAGAFEKDERRRGFVVIWAPHSGCCVRVCVCCGRPVPEGKLCCLAPNDGSRELLQSTVDELIGILCVHEGQSVIDAAASMKRKMDQAEKARSCQDPELDATTVALKGLLKRRPGESVVAAAERVTKELEWLRREYSGFTTAPTKTVGSSVRGFSAASPYYRESSAQEHSEWDD